MSVATDCGSPRVPGAYVRTSSHAQIFAGKLGVETVTETNAVMTDFRPPPTFRRVIILVFASVAAVIAVVILAVGVIRLSKRRRRQGETSSTESAVQNEPRTLSSPPTPMQQPLSSCPQPPLPSSPPSNLPNALSNVPGPAVEATATRQLPAPTSESTNPLPQDPDDNELLHALDVWTHDLQQPMADMSLTYDPYACTREQFQLPESREST